MGRKEQRKAAKKENVPELFELFEATADPRNPYYITYSNRMMPGQLYFKGVAGIVSMQG